MNLKTVFLSEEEQPISIAKTDACVMALGFFDGVHLGHRKVIQTASEIAKVKGLTTAVMTFFPHPKEVISDGKMKVDYLTSLAQKEEILSLLGVDCLYVVAFNRRFAMLSPEQFIEKYVTQLGAEHVVAGFDFTYGYRGQGNMERIAVDGKGAFSVTKVQKVALNGEKISSTLIRSLILAGEVDKVSAYLGKEYQIAGSLQFNQYEITFINVDNNLLPKPGAYYVSVHDGKETHSAIAQRRNHDDNLLLQFTNSIAPFPENAWLTITWHKRFVQDKQRFGEYFDVQTHQ